MEDKLLSWHILQNIDFEEYKMNLDTKRKIDMHKRRLKQLLDMRDEINASLIQLHEGLIWLQSNKNYLCTLLTNDIVSSHFDTNTIAMNSECHDQFSNIFNNFKKISNNFDSYNELAAKKPNININHLEDDILSIVLNLYEVAEKIFAELTLLEEFRNNMQFVKVLNK